MKVITVAQNKGGTGKTTVARLLAEYFSQKGLRVVGIDLDPQCSFSQRFVAMDSDPTDPDGILPPVHPDYDPSDAGDWNGRSSIADIFFGKEVVPYPTRLPNLDLLVGNGERLRKVELVTEDQVKDRVHDRLAQFLAIPDVAQNWDLAIIDTSPSKGPLTVSAIRAATHLLIPTIMEQQSIEGLRGMLQLWRRENRGRTKPLEIIGILPNKFRRNVALQVGIRESLAADPSVASLLIPHSLGLRAAFAEADHPEAEPHSVFELGGSNEAKEEATAMAAFVARKVGL